MQVQYYIVIAIFLGAATIFISRKLARRGSIVGEVLSVESDVEEVFPLEPDIEYLAFPRLIGMPIVMVFDEVMRMSKD
jgi:hypothetical protein